MNLGELTFFKERPTNSLHDFRNTQIANCDRKHILFIIIYLLYTSYVSTFWGIPARLAAIVVASLLPYGLLVRITSNTEKTYTCYVSTLWSFGARVTPN